MYKKLIMNELVAKSNIISVERYEGNIPAEVGIVTSRNL